MWRYWAVTEQGIYFATAEVASHPLIEFFSFTTGKITPVARLDAPLSKTDPGLAVAPDGQWLLVVQMDQSGSDIVMAHDFR
jgi:hypothetical protein